MHRRISGRVPFLCAFVLLLVGLQLLMLGKNLHLDRYNISQTGYSTASMLLSSKYAEVMGDLPSSVKQKHPQSTTTDKHRVCSSFFSVMSSAYLPNEQRSTGGPCAGLGRYGEVLKRQSLQMAALNSTLTIFTSWSEQKLNRFEAECNKPFRELDRIFFQQFDADALLHKYNFTADQMRWIQNWHKTASHKEHVPERLADLLRIILAKENGMAYLDLDMIPVPPATSNRSQPADLYLESPCVAVPIWAEGNGALEIQNSGFCFTGRQLDHLIGRMKTLIDSKGETQVYPTYTDMGPKVFLHSLQSLIRLDPINLLFTTSNDDGSVSKVLNKAQRFDSEIYWFHLDSRFRGGNVGEDNKLGKAFDQIFDTYTPKALE